MSAGQNGIDGYLLPGSVKIGPTDSMRCGQFIDLLQFPWLTRIAVMMQNAHFADAFRGVVREFPRDNDLGNAIVINVLRGAVDQVCQTGGEHVRLPCRIFVPHQIGISGSQPDNVGLAVMVQVGDHYLIAALQPGGNGVFGELQRGLRQQGSGESK